MRTLYRKPTDDEMFADNVIWDETGFVPVEPDREIHAPDGTLLGVVIYNEAGRAFAAKAETAVERCPACNGDGVLHKMDGDIVGPCTECAP